jgi:hypothetical protein
VLFCADGQFLCSRKRPVSSTLVGMPRSRSKIELRVSGVNWSLKILRQISPAAFNPTLVPTTPGCCCNQGSCLSRIFRSSSAVSAAIVDPKEKTSTLCAINHYVVNRTSWTTNVHRRLIMLFWTSDEFFDSKCCDYGTDWICERHAGIGTSSE